MKTGWITPAHRTVYIFISIALALTLSLVVLSGLASAQKGGAMLPPGGPAVGPVAAGLPLVERANASAGQPAQPANAGRAYVTPVPPPWWPDRNPTFLPPVTPPVHSAAGQSARVASGVMPAAVAARNGTRLTGLQPPVTGPADLVVCLETQRVWGMVGAGETVTVTVKGVQMGAALADGHGFFWTTLYDPATGGRPPLDVGNVIAIYHNGVLAGAVTVHPIDGTLDPLANRATGTIGGVSAPVSVTVYIGGSEPDINQRRRTVDTNSSGDFLADFTGLLDLSADESANVGYVENGIEVHGVIHATGLAVAPPPNPGVYGWTRPGTVVTITVYYSDAVTVRDQVIDMAAGNGYYYFSPAIETGDLVVVELVDGRVLIRRVDPLTKSIDVWNDRITGLTTPGAVVMGYGFNLTTSGSQPVQVFTVADPTGLYTLTFAGQADLRPGDWSGVYIQNDPEQDDLGLWSNTPYLDVNQTWNFVSGWGADWLDPLMRNQPVTLTIYSAAAGLTSIYTQTMSDDYYRFEQSQYGLPNIDPGDVITVESATWQGWVAVTAMTADYDLAADQISGSITLPSNRVEPAAWQWNNGPYPVGGSAETLATTTGSFVSPLTGFDLRSGVNLDVAHRTPAEYVERISRSVEVVEVSVEGNYVWTPLYPSGTAYTFTVYTGGGGLKAQILGISSGEGGDAWHNFGDEGQSIDIGDRVWVQADNGYSQTVIVPTLIITPDVAADIVYGQGPADALLYLDIQNQGGGYVPTDHTGRFAVAVNQLQNMWGDGDLQWSNRVYVYYLNPQGNRVQYDYPAPEIWVDKYPANGSARPGGVFVYYLNYGNNGDRPAENIILTDTLPLLTTYRGDTSGVPPEIGPDGVMTWTLGALEPGAQGGFYVTLNVDPTLPVGDESLAGNCVGATTDTPGDYNLENNFRCTNPVAVVADEVEVGVNKWPNPGDPAPGETFQYHLNVCNNRSAAVGPVWLVDMFPAHTSLVGWAPEADWAAYWVEESATAEQLVLRAPGLPGWGCYQVILTLAVDADAPYGLSLPNRVEVFATDDVYLDNNTQLNTDARVSLPRHDLYIDKWLDNAVLVPGGYAYYHIYYENHGNTAASVTITDTLPAGVTYQPGSARRNNQPFEPDIATATELVWEGISVAPSQSGDFSFQVRLNADTAVGAVLTNTAVVAGALPEDTPADNRDQVVATVHDHGPNLQVFKSHSWQGDNNESRLQYYLEFRNVGDQPVGQVVITDTYPVSTTFNGEYNLGFWEEWTWTPVPDNQISIQLSRLEPGWSLGGWFNVDLDPEAVGQRLRWYTNTLELMPVPGDVDLADNSYEDVAFSGGEVSELNLRVGTETSDMWGQAQANGWVTVTTAYAEVAIPVGQPGCGACWSLGNNGVNAGPVYPGDVVTVTAGGGLQPVVVTVPAPFTANANPAARQVSGRVDNLANAMLEINLYDRGSRHTQTDGAGNYLATFADMPRGAQGEVIYPTTVADAAVYFRHQFQSPDLILTVNYAHDWVEINYEVSHTISITVTDQLGNIKATQTDVTQIVPWWGGRSGYSTNLGTWVPSQPDIAVGDWVYGALDNGYTSSVRIGALDGALDLAADSLVVSPTVPWVAQLLKIDSWIDNAPVSGCEFYVPPVGGSEVCYFSFDLTPLWSVSAQYQEPDGDWVRNVFQPPVARLNIQTWGNNQPGEGSNYALTVRYENRGTAPAENTVVTSTLEGMTYLSDGSGYPALVSGNVITWSLGTVPPQSSSQFDVFVHVDAMAGENITQTVQIATDSFDQTDGVSKEAAWWGTVQASDVNLNVGTGAWTWQPAPGYAYVYYANVCHGGSTGSAEVTLTNTLPISTTLLDWWGQNPGWVEESRSANQLVVSRPTLSSGCEQVYVRVSLDPAALPGDPLHYRVDLAASNDTNPDDNYSDTWHNVGGPYYDLGISKDWNWGTLAPGGEVRYGIGYRNNGSLPIATTIRLTDTLPENTTFLAAWRYDQQGQHLFTPTVTTADYLVWEISALDNGFGGDFEVALRLDAGVAPGTVFTNCAAISADVPEYENPYDNQDCVADTVRAAGPNLRVTKTAEWQNNGNQLQYRVRLENVGTEPVNDVTVTDTYPAAFSLNWWNINWNPWNLAPGDNPFVLTLEGTFNPGQTADLYMNVITGGVSAGDFFTNTAQITLPPGDVNPADNLATVVSGAGPDLSVEKWVTGGSAIPRPGEWLTYTLHIANRSTQWNSPGQTLITDTLPAGLEFIDARQRLCGPGNYFCERLPVQNGQVLTWNWDSLCPNCWNDLLVTVRVTDTAQGGQLLINQVEVRSEDPTQIEPDWLNNTSSVAVTVLNPNLSVSKVYAGGRVAGTVVSYTLSVTNTGNLTATLVTLRDQVPTGATYGASNGVYASPYVTWTLAGLGPDGVWNSAWFSGTLACTAGTPVDNSNYQVVDTAEGVTSPIGPAVSFNIIAPTLTASITHTAGTLVVSDTVHFTATASTDGTPLSYQWNFGDGGLGSGLTASHVYTRSGSFTTYFTATDACNYTNVQTTTLTISPPTLVANFTYLPSPANIAVGQAVTFTNASTTNGPAIVAWEWNFGDTFTGTVMNPTHVYNTAGTYTVTLKVTDALGNWDIETKLNIVSVSQFIEYRIYLPLIRR